ncbi:hypothetical protein [Desulfonema limicola]|uniref:hypothetical protein n=1 Tax=Desulfonema limicola TaxID=45656 RepID=UPI001A9AAF2E|nr:hypothetical protein [Desulfonema limicola]
MPYGNMGSLGRGKELLEKKYKIQIKAKKIVTPVMEKQSFSDSVAINNIWNCNLTLSDNYNHDKA